MVGQFVILTEKKSRQDRRQSRNLVKWTLGVGAPHPESLVTGKDLQWQPSHLVHR